MIENNEIKDEFEIGYCDECIQITNHIGDECQKCKTGVSGLGPNSSNVLASGEEKGEGVPENAGGVNIDRNSFHSDSFEEYGEIYKCPKCSFKYIREDDKFCCNCGIKLNWVG